ncbi:hypothetical protein EZV62_028099 [Acer yangbiense]|uniref:Uncharacterized protein n=1 Tax=Acer yangbiense TaxID=1000413 RepID=A0A5C7GP90_9ROSI|nr:hypothetical protein EZV62_028099 [Acer yangbiense]
MKGEFNINSVWKAVETAMACVCQTSSRRPTMNNVVLELNECLATETARRKENANEFETGDSVEMMTVNPHNDVSPLARGAAVEVLTPFIFSQKPPDHNSRSRHLKGLNFALETKIGSSEADLQNPGGVAAERRRNQPHVPHAPTEPPSSSSSPTAVSSSFHRSTHRRPFPPPAQAVAHPGDLAGTIDLAELRWRGPDEESSIADVLSWEGRLRIETETAEGLEYLHSGCNTSANLLSWERKLQIATEAAQGLESLHSGCYKDVKSTNIFLNEKLEAKLADLFESSHTKSFPLSQIESYVNDLAEGDIKNVVDPRLQGDFDVNSAWRAVEVAMACVSQTSAKRPTMNQVVIDLNESLAIEIARTKIESYVNDLAEGDIKNVVDPRLQGDFDMNSAWRAVEVAMACVSQTSAKRPTMNQVVSNLNESLAIEIARTKVGREAECSIKSMSLNMNYELPPLARSSNSYTDMLAKKGSNKEDTKPNPEIQTHHHHLHQFFRNPTTPNPTPTTKSNPSISKTITHHHPVPDSNHIQIQEVALLLIRHGADVDVEDKEGYTVLGRASNDFRPILIDAVKAMLEG